VAAGGICGELSVDNEDVEALMLGKAQVFNYKIIFCSNRGVIAGPFAGGICGKVSPGSAKYKIGGLFSISHCYNSGLIANGVAGGIVGKFVIDAEGQINNCYNTGNIEVRDFKTIVSGGICGIFMTKDGGISNCYNSGDLIGEGMKDNLSKATVGGICGESGNVIKNCFAVNGQITCNVTTPVIGRIVGSDAGEKNSYSYNNNDNDRYGTGVGGRYRVENCYALSSMLLNGRSYSSLDATGVDGQDQSADIFKSREWLKNKLSWDFQTWSMGDSGYPEIE
jgi:hypothetical protein